MGTPLRERNAPQARVFAYIKDPVYGGSGRKFVELNGFTSVNSNISMSGMGGATITFPNFKSSRIRFINENSIEAVEFDEDKGSYAETMGALKSAHDFIGHITPESDIYFKNIWNDMVYSDGTTPINEQSWALGSQQRADLSKTDVGDRNIRKQIRGGDKTGLTRTVHALPFVNLFDSIFIDYIGQDGLQYAGFTGLISRISDSYTKTGDQSITVQCSDLTTLFDNISIISGWNRLSVSETNSSFRDFIYYSEANKDAAQHAAFQNIFSSNKYNKVTDIIKDLVEMSQQMWRLDSVKGGSDNIGIKSFKFDTSQVYAYNGISGRRGSNNLTSDIENMSPEDFKTSKNLYKYHYMFDSNIMLSSVHGSENGGLKKILVDPLILKMDNMFIHKLLSNSLSLYKDSLKSADSILNDLCAKMLAYKYFDANGNMIIELAKYNSIPNLTTYGGRSTGIVVTHKVPAKNVQDPKTKDEEVTIVKVTEGMTKQKLATNNEITVKKLVELNAGYGNASVFVKVVPKVVPPLRAKAPYYVLRAGADVRVKVIKNTKKQDPLKRFKSLIVEANGSKVLETTDDAYPWSTILFHGKNYVLASDDFISFSTTMDEAALTTLVTMNANYGYIESLPDNLRLSSPQLHGVATVDAELYAVLGVRRFQTQNLYNVSWPSPEQGARVLSYMSAAVLARMNAQADSGTMMLNHRPELQLGRTYMNPLRMKSYLIMGISNSWSPGSDHTTSLTISYGKPIHKALETPWTAIYSEPNVFGFDSVADYGKLAASNANSNVKADEVLEEVNK